MKYITQTSAITLGLVMLVGFSAPAYADREDVILLAEAKVSLTQAIEKAQQHQGGQAIEASLDDDSFEPAYEVSVVKDNRIYDVRINAVNGEVLGSREDLDD